LTPNPRTVLVEGVRDIDNRRGLMLLNTLRHRQYGELCELLGGWRNPSWMDLMTGSGEPEITLDGVSVNGRLVGYSLCRRVHFDLDWTNYVLAQVWDHQADHREWEFVLLYNCADNHWVPEQVYSWGAACPTYAEAGAVVDEIEDLRRRAPTR
jgi:hypothetical protein